MINFFEKFPSYHVSVENFRKGVTPFKRAATIGSASKPVHALSVQTAGFVEPDSCLSCSGDYSLHFGPLRVLNSDGGAKGSGRGSGGSFFCSCAFFLFMLAFVGIVLLWSGVSITDQMSLKDIVALEGRIAKRIAERGREVSKLMADFQEVADRRTGRAEL